MWVQVQIALLVQALLVSNAMMHVAPVDAAAAPTSTRAGS
jgi:hypothetical protein